MFYLSVILLININSRLIGCIYVFFCFKCSLTSNVKVLLSSIENYSACVRKVQLFFQIGEKIKGNEQKGKQSTMYRKLKTEQNAPDIKREVNSDLHCNAKFKPIINMYNYQFVFVNFQQHGNAKKKNTIFLINR